MRIHCLLRNPKKKGMTAIYFTVAGNGKRIILFPGESIDTANWITKNGVNTPKPSPANNSLIGRLSRFEQLIRDTHDELRKKYKGIVPGNVLKAAIYQKHKPTGDDEDLQILVRDFFQTMIDDTRNKKRLSQSGRALGEPTVKTYEVTLDHFINFETIKKMKYHLKSIDQDLIDSFSDYLNITLNMAFNGSGKNMKNFRTMMNYARQKKLVSNEVILDNKVTVTTESPDNIFLDELTIEKIAGLTDFPTTLHEVVRDYFVMGCKTGLRYSDFSRLDLANIENRLIRSSHEKTSIMGYVPAHILVRNIFEKYSGHLPKCPSNQVFNRYLKELGQRLPELDVNFEKTITRSREREKTVYKKWQLLQTHTARRSFCTNEYLAGTPVYTIMAISGHKTEKSFRAYIKADSLQHAKILRDRWENEELKKQSAA